MKNTSISLGNYFDQFVQTQVSAGRYKNVSEVIRAGLRLLESEESKVIALRNAIQEGLNSPLVEEFDFDENLKRLKSEKKKQIENLKKRMIEGLSTIGETKFDTGLYKGYIRKGQQSVKVLNVGLVPDEYVETKITESVNKAEVKAAINKGETIPGCSLETGNPSLIIK